MKKKSYQMSLLTLLLACVLFISSAAPLTAYATSEDKSNVSITVSDALSVYEGNITIVLSNGDWSEEISIAPSAFSNEQVFSYDIDGETAVDITTDSGWSVVDTNSCSALSTITLNKGELVDLDLLIIPTSDNENEEYALCGRDLDEYFTELADWESFSGTNIERDTFLDNISLILSTALGRQIVIGENNINDTTREELENATSIDSSNVSTDLEVGKTLYNDVAKVITGLFSDDTSLLGKNRVSNNQIDALVEHGCFTKEEFDSLTTDEWVLYYTTYYSYWFSYMYDDFCIANYDLNSACVQFLGYYYDNTDSQNGHVTVKVGNVINLAINSNYTNSYSAEEIQSAIVNFTVWQINYWIETGSPYDFMHNQSLFDSLGIGQAADTAESEAKDESAELESVYAELATDEEVQEAMQEIQAEIADEDTATAATAESGMSAGTIAVIVLLVAVVCVGAFFGVRTLSKRQ